MDFFDSNLCYFPDFGSSDSIVLGIDEAGRGPTLGPMVYAAAFCESKDLEILKEMGYQDSKKLTFEKRDELFYLLKNNNRELKIGYIIKVITPEELSGLMTNIFSTNLNEISHNAAIDIIKYSLKNKITSKEIYIDTVGPPEYYRKKLNSIFPQIKIIVSKKADDIYPIVSAASICAKVVRDKCLASWNFSEEIQISRDWGSGYPSDPKTKTWMKKNLEKIFGFPRIVRFSWKPCIQLIDAAAFPVKWREDQAKNPEPKNQLIKSDSKITFSSPIIGLVCHSNTSIGINNNNNLNNNNNNNLNNNNNNNLNNNILYYNNNRFRYFKERNLEIVIDF